MKQQRESSVKQRVMKSMVAKSLLLGLLWLWQVGGIEWAGNITLFLLWMIAVSTMFSVANEEWLSKEPLPQWAEWFGRLVWAAIAILMAADGRFVLALAMVFAASASAYVHRERCGRARA